MTLPILNLTSTLRMDPTRTTTLRSRYMGEMGRRFRTVRVLLRKAIVDLDVLGLKERKPLSFNESSLTTHALPEREAFRFLANPEKVTEFNKWFQTQIDSEILSTTAKGNPWTSKYVHSAYKQGSLRAYMDSHPEAMAEKPDFYKGRREQFLESAFNQPERLSKLRLLYNRSYEDLKGITGAMSQQISRHLADGLAQGLSPKTIARTLARDVDQMTRTRARTMARTEVIHAHAEGQLDSFEELGVKELKVMAEWSTAGDDRVCPKCEALEGTVMTVEEARGLIPRHPNCRCAWTPANVGELEARRKRYWSLLDKKKRVNKSLMADLPKKTRAGKKVPQTVREAKRRSTWPGKDLKPRKPPAGVDLDVPKATPPKPKIPMRDSTKGFKDREAAELARVSDHSGVEKVWIDPDGVIYKMKGMDPHPKWAERVVGKTVDELEQAGWIRGSSATDYSVHGLSEEKLRRIQRGIDAVSGPGGRPDFAKIHVSNYYRMPDGDWASTTFRTTIGEYKDAGFNLRKALKVKPTDLFHWSKGKDLKPKAPPAGVDLGVPVAPKTTPPAPTPRTKGVAEKTPFDQRGSVLKTSTPEVESFANPVEFHTFEDRTRGVWKPASKDNSILRPGIRYSGQAKREVIASRAAEEVGMGDLVPHTEWGTYKGQRGTYQAFRKGYTVDDLPREWTRPTYRDLDGKRSAAYDFIMGSGDRHGGNLLLESEGGQLSLIDNGLSLSSSPKSGFLSRPLRAQVELDKIDDAVKAAWRGKKSKLAKIMREEGLSDDAISLFEARHDAFMKSDTWGQVRKLEYNGKLPKPAPKITPPKSKRK